MAHRVVIAASALFMAASVASGQSEGGLPGKSDTPPSAPVLSGPRVDDVSRPRTLVERDETGRIKRLEVPPAEAALRLLDLDDRTKARIDSILESRAAALDAIVRKNLLLLVRLSNAAQSGDAKEQRTLVRELVNKAEPLRERGPLQDELVRALPDKQADELKRLVHEYGRAIFDEARSANSDSMRADEALSGRDGLARRAQAEYAAAVGREIKRSYERVVTAAVKDFDEFLRKLDLGADKEAEIRRLATDHFQKSAGDPSPAQRAELFAKIYRELTPEQRRVLLDTVRVSKR